MSAGSVSSSGRPDAVEIPRVAYMSPRPSKQAGTGSASRLARHRKPRNYLLYSRQCAMCSTQPDHGNAGNIDENGSLPYKPRQLSAMARFDRGGSFGPETARFGPASIGGLISINRQIARSAENDP